MTKKPTETPTQQRVRLVHLIARRGWLFRAFHEVGAWRWLLPWPFGKVLRFGGNTEDNGWMTAAIAIFFGAHFVAGSFAVAFATTYAPDIAKTLYSGAFLVGSVLGLSIALPGQTLAKFALGDDPKFALDFILPLVWGFVWSLAGAVAMTFFPSIVSVWAGHPRVISVCVGLALFVSLFGALMVLNSLLQTIRMYIMGMLMWSADIAEADAVKKKATDEARAAAAVTSRERADAEAKRLKSLAAPPPSFLASGIVAEATAAAARAEAVAEREEAEAEAERELRKTDSRR